MIDCQTAINKHISNIQWHEEYLCNNTKKENLLQNKK